MAVRWAMAGRDSARSGQGSGLAGISSLASRKRFQMEKLHRIPRPVCENRRTFPIS
jgi:hypothetical protein